MKFDKVNIGDVVRIHSISAGCIREGVVFFKSDSFVCVEFIPEGADKKGKYKECFREIDFNGSIKEAN